MHTLTQHIIFKLKGDKIMNAIEAKQKAIKEFKAYLEATHKKQGTMYAAVSRQTGEVILAKTQNGALQLQLTYTFEVSKEYPGDDIIAVICDY